MNRLFYYKDIIKDFSSSIDNLHNFMNNIFDNINKIICKRSRIINFKLLFLFIAKNFLVTVVILKLFHYSVCILFPLQKLLLLTKEKNTPSSIFYDLNNDLINFVIV